MKKFFLCGAFIIFSFLSNYGFLNSALAQINNQAYFNLQGSTNDSISSNIEPLELVAVSPQPDAANVCIDTQLRLIFNKPPILSESGIIKILDNTGATIDSIDGSISILTKTIGGLPNFNYYAIIINGNEAIITFKNIILSYGKNYEVKITDGLFIDSEGNAANLEVAKIWRFTTKSSAPVLPIKGPRRISVAADNSADFATVQGALDFIPAGNTTATSIFIHNGTYNEIIYFSDKHNLTIIGEDRKQTIIEYADNQNLNNTDRNMMPGGYRRGVLRAVNCNDLTITHLTLRNPTPAGGGQSEAVILNGGANAHAIITDVDMSGHQDTLQINGQAYISNCYIEGDVDFMWGIGPCFFENCQLRALRNKSMYTQIRNPATNHGYIYKNCIFEGAPGIRDCILSRVSSTRFPASEVVLLNCTLTGAVSPAGWRLDGPSEAPNVHFWEYNSHDPDGKPIDDSERFVASKRLTMETDAQTIANYSNPVWVLGTDWNPRLALIFTKPPASTNVSAQLKTGFSSTPQVSSDPCEIPIPYIDTPMGKLPSVDELHVIKEMPEVLTMNNGEKVTTLEQWKQRREEIRHILEYYATGQVPPAPGNVKGTEVNSITVSQDKVKYRMVHLTFGPEEKLSLDIGIFTPNENGPFPAIIIQGGTPPGATPLPRLPNGPNQGRGQNVLVLVGPEPQSNQISALHPVPISNAERMAQQYNTALQRGYAVVLYNANDCAEDTTLRNLDGSWAFRNTRFFPAYPNYDWGILAAWAWGASRVADYLEQDPTVDKKILIITGASRNGKSSMIAAAYDERFIGAPVVTGGGGVGAHRFAGPRRSETLDIMETKYPNWFSPNLHQFRGHVDKLPFDQHWFLALCAPRPFIALEGMTDTISLPEAVKQSIIGAQPAYELYQAKDKLGVNYANHGHMFTNEDWTAMLDFVEKHMRNKSIERSFDRFPTEAELDAAAGASGFRGR